MSISTNELLLALSIAAVLGGSLAYLFWKQRKEAAVLLAEHEEKKARKLAQTNQKPAASLQLQAYERLILLADRISLNSLINRVNQPGLSLREMQSVLVSQIRQEFEYNITQQIYVSAEAWDAVKNLKDQNLLIINQVASFLPPESTGNDLNKAILEMLMNNPQASLHSVVSEVLAYEAKKLMK